MAYLDVRFPELIGRDPVGGPTFSTEIATTSAGLEQRAPLRTRSRCEFDFSHSVKSTRDFRAVGAHFRMARGKLHKFRVLDYSDYQCERGDGTVLTTTAGLQVYKRYGSGDLAEYRKITRLVDGTLQVWVADVLTSVTVDVETGILTGSVPGDGTAECSFEFDVPCRYDTDKLQATLVQFNRDRQSYHAWTSVPLIEVRE